MSFLCKYLHCSPSLQNMDIISGIGMFFPLPLTHIGCGSSDFSNFNIRMHHLGSSQVAQMVKNPPAMQETWVWPLGWKDPLEEGMATHFSILAWRSPWTEEPGGLQSMELQRVGHIWGLSTKRTRARRLEITVRCRFWFSLSGMGLEILYIQGLWGPGGFTTPSCILSHSRRDLVEQREVGDQDEGLTGRRQWSASAFRKGM